MKFSSKRRCRNGAMGQKDQVENTENAILFCGMISGLFHYETSSPSFISDFIIILKYLHGPTWGMSYIHPPKN
jgi:hypothetical protein